MNPYAIKVLEEIGIDISITRSKNANQFIGTDFEMVVTVCDKAKRNCPFFPGAKEYLHQSFTDPSDIQGFPEKILSAFRKTRDTIKDWLQKQLQK